MPEKYDVIVIGAGIGGLTTAAILAKNGKRVLVLEKNSMPGGYAVNFRRKKFEFDAAIHLLNGFGQGQVGAKILEACGINNEVTFLEPKHLFRSIFPDIDIQVPQGNPKEYINILTRYFPKERSGLEKLFKLMSGLFYRIDNTGEVSDRISPADFSDYVYKSYQELLDQFLKDKKLMAIVSQLWSYYGLPPSKLSAIFFSYPWHDYICNKGYYPKGGSRAISTALMNITQKNKGEFKFKANVTRVILRDNAACGVATEKGEEFFADSVISNVDARTTFSKFIDKKSLPGDFLEGLSDMEPSLSAFQVYLGLNVDLEKNGLSDYVTFINPGFNFDSQYESFLKNDINNAPFGITFHSVIDRDFAPKDKSALAVLVLAGYDFWKGLSKEAYAKQKEHFTNVLIKKAESIIPNLSSYIEIVESATPLTMERYTGNYKGALYGWSQTVPQSGSNRLKNKTPVKNLYLAGAWTQPGGGIKGAMQSAVITASKVMDKDS